jgi:predicted kinase
MAKCYQLVGVPAAGKSTWINSQVWAKDCAYISTDKFVDAYAHEVGKTYSEVFKDFMPHAVKMMAAEVVQAREQGKDIIWDQTSVSIASREKKFRMLPDYEHIAVVFCTPEPAELARRLASRPGKHIPKNVIDSMISNWDEPTEDEGFTEIWYV